MSIYPGCAGLELFAQPLARGGILRGVEVSGLRLRERFDQDRHAMLPFVVSDCRDALKVVGMLNVEFDLVPKRAGVPALETDHVEQQAQLTRASREPCELGKKMLIISLFQLSPYVNHEELLATHLVDPDRHFRRS